MALCHVIVSPAQIGCSLERPFFVPPLSLSLVPYALLEECRSLSSVPGPLADGSESESIYTNTVYITTRIIKYETDKIISIENEFIRTLQVNDRVHGRLVSGSTTPQCLLGSKILPAQQ